MLSHVLYYTVKPYVPWRVRMALRRVVAERIRARSAQRWPIVESAGRPPSLWRGWPEGRQFAFVLTHDVEGPAGLAKCRRLAELELELGFRSSFNFIPEGSYRLPVDLRTWLARNGFEVGVHDLCHDGRLFESRRTFRQKAARINEYVRTWGASGFRSAFMLRELDAIHQLDVQYDSSTFDTDPFEFQPEGTGTIFPFWIPTPGNSPAAEDGPCAASRGGYVELPYTLPQDSTLFLVLRERTSSLWLRKLDWVAEHGGMALVNVHPDYIRFPGDPASPRTYPLDRYLELLEHVRQRHANAYWQPLPRAVADHAAQALHADATAPSV